MRLSLLAGALAGAVTMGAMPAWAADPVRIGFITTLTTPAAAIGRDMQDGVNLAVEHVGGTIAGRPIEVLFEDDGLKPELGRQKAEKLVRQDNVAIVAGFIWSNVLLAARKPVTDAGKILISTNAGPSELAGKGCQPNFFSTRGPNDMVSVALGRLLNERSVKKLYIIMPNYAAGKDMAAGVERGFTGAVVGRDFTKWGDDPQLDFSAEFAKAKASGADAIAAFYPGRATAFARQFQQAGIADRVKLFTINTFDDIALPRLQEANIEAALNTDAADFWSADIDTPENKRFVEGFRKRYGRTPSLYAAFAYDLIPYVKAAIEQAGGDLAATGKLRKTLEAADYRSVRGPYRIGPNHYPIEPYFALKVVKGADGTWALRNDGVALKDEADSYVKDCHMAP